MIPLGGLGEFGMNIMALRYGDDIVVIDAGMMFPGSELLGVDIVVPDITYLKDNRERVRGLVLTHGHEDHIGAVPFVLGEMDIPVYGTQFTLALVERRLDEYELPHKPRLKRVRAGETIQVGCFSIEFIHVTHSMVDAAALAITTPVGVVIHSGDFKIDPSPTDNELFDLHTLADYGRRGVLLLMSDSTNAEWPGFTPSERAIRGRMEEIFLRAEGSLVISCFSSSTHRVQQMLELSYEYKRKVALVGRSMTSTAEIAHELGFLTVPDGLLVRPGELDAIPRRQRTVLIAGSQGEPMSALARVSLDKHKHISVEKGDTVVLSSRIIPGNETAIFRMIDHLSRRGAEVIYGSTTPPIHVSGHASQEELNLMLNLARPKYFVPIHGEFRQLARHAALAEHLKHAGLEESFVLESGEVLEIDSAGARKAAPVPVGRLCIDSGSVDEIVEDLIIHDRRNLSEDGIVMTVIAINRHTGELESQPEIVTRGFVTPEDGAEMVSRAREIVVKTLEGSSGEEKGDYGVIKAKISADLKKFIAKETSRRPLILPVILEV
ncbi:MAG TPA: ribonuclease J [Bryobacterales bacterium]|nr:ribonuclease J [Bryobacterales bacterium]